MQMMRSKSLSSPSPSNQGQQQADLSDLQLRKKLSSSFTRQLQLNTSPIEPQTYAIVNSILRSSISFNSCKICEKKLQFNQLISLTNCDHKFCQQCLTQYCLYKIKVNEDVLCPEQGCKQKLTQESKIYKQLPIQMQQKFKQHQVWKQSLQNPNIKLCPNEKCVGGQVDLLKIPPECGKCGKKYCKECMMDFHEGGCDQNFQEHFKQWKRCPKCKVFIQKNEGCNHMTCTCTHQFCFVCLANWQNSHYQCVQGNNRLFYNELQSMPKEKALLNLIGMIFALPLLVLVIAFIIVMGAAIAFLVAVICAPCIGIGCMRDCGFICRLLCLVIVIPIITVVGAGLAVLISIFLVTIPYSKKLVVKYSNTCKFLLQQLRSKQNRPINIVSTGAMMEQI